MTDRIESVRRLLARRGDDVFLVYSLGMELASAGRFDEAAEQFRRVMVLDRDYLPAYAEAGKALRSAGRHDEAAAVLNDGLALAERLGNDHAADHLRSLLELG